MEIDPEKITHVAFNTIYGIKFQKGFVELLFNEEVVCRWDIPKARELHAIMGQAIEAAITDEMLVNFFKTKLNMEDEIIALMLRDFRLLRQGQLKTVYPT